ncbi:MAG: hypothetical protein L3J47_08495 [Sulfurovum sp.]|nr:hypothetical protein [Sulfurovum sp.]
MIKVQVRFALLALFLPLLLNATHILKNDLLNLNAAKFVERIASELEQKTGVHEYLIATNEHFPPRYNLVEYSKKYEANMSKPYVLMVFAPFAKLTEASEQRGRVGIIPSSPEVAAMYNKSDVLDATIDVVASADKNSQEDKNAIGMVQGISELADQIARSKGVTLTETIKDARGVLWIMQILVFIGTAFVLWIFLIKPLFRRKHNG